MKFNQAFHLLVNETETFIQGINRIIGIRHFEKNNKLIFEILDISINQKSYIDDKVTMFEGRIISGSLFEPIYENYYTFHDSSYILALHFRDFLNIQFHLYPEFEEEHLEIQDYLKELLPQLPEPTFCTDNETKKIFEEQLLLVLKTLQENILNSPIDWILLTWCDW